MRKKHLLKVLPLIIIPILLTLMWNRAQANTPSIAKLNIPFITNQGQTNEKVRFYTKTMGGAVFVTTDGEIVYSLHKFDNRKNVKGLALQEEFVDGMVKDIRGEKKSVTKVSYFAGKDPSKWRSNIPTYDLVDLGEVYQRIELKLKAYGNNIEKLFYVKHGANPENIRVRIKGAKALKVSESGGLEVETELGTVRFTKPVAYQLKTVNNQRSTVSNDVQNRPVRQGGLTESDKQYIDVAYIVKGNTYTFKVGDYDRTRELVIDPLLASTYLGGISDDYANALAIDSEGNVYVTGTTISTDFPTKTGAYDTSYNASFDVFISKFDGNLTTLLASTFLGGISNESANAIAINSYGKVYVAGKTLSTEFPTTSDAYDTTLNFYDAFVAKFSGDLTDLLASTYLGGRSSESATSIIIGSDESVYVSGESLSADFPTIPGAYDTSFNGSYDVFVSKLDSKLTTLLASTYLGGSSIDNPYSIALDTNGNIYLAGSTISANFPTTPGAFDTIYNGSYDVFVSKLNGKLTTLLASTYLGGGGSEKANSIAVTKNGDVFVAGETLSPNFPTTTGAYDTSYNASLDAFVSRLNGDLTTLLACTFLGGLANDSARSITLDLCGNVYVTGYTGSTDFPTTPGAFDTSYNGGFTDAFITALKGDLTSPLLYSTFLGGTGNDAFSTMTCFDKCFFADIAIDSRRNVYVAGETNSSDFPTTSGAFDEVYNGSRDVFISKLSISLPVAQYTLTVNKDGTGSGMVTSGPAGIDCGSVCTDTFKACTQVTLRADPDDGSTFAGWSGPCTGVSTTCTVAMNKDKTVKATFNTCTYSITPKKQTFYASGGKGTINVTTQSDCTWTAASSVDWITITSGSNGTGNGTVKYSVTPNTLTTLRTGNITIAGNTFTVTQNGAIIVLTPNGGEIIASGSFGSPYPITWDAPVEATKFDLLLSFDSGLTWRPIANDVVGTSYPWTVPKPLGNQKKCLVKVIGYDASDVKVGSDKSDAPFTIEVVRLTAPSDTGISLTSGDPYTITWTTNDTKRPIGKVKLFLSKNGGVTWEVPPIATFIGSNPGSYGWTVPDVSKTKSQCKIKVELKGEDGIVLGKDASDNPFAIQPSP